MWLTAEIAAQDKDADGIPDSNSKAFTVKVNGEKALKLDEPSWDSGILNRCVIYRDGFNFLS